ncbi:S-adenosyl-methyltransferase MraW [Candidatus Zinderia insecticola CARI]|uniref:S-adenosyl-methyltransferase MraW n=1 Tax=Zinderia insecticola (strain CARI) TaxID=871271 RepID=E0TIR1_ZINIC|nr:S-adenosyl-methyltransferase MraW [Candidatus Zinderia insecticola CARI]
MKINNKFPILISEIFNILKNIKINKDIFIDATMGMAKHLKKINKKIEIKKILAFEKDNLIFNRNKIKMKKIFIVNDNFKNIFKILKLLKIKKINFILFDLGISLFQIINKNGFSYKKNSLLDMRINNKLNKPAYKILNNYKKEKILKIFNYYRNKKYFFKIVNLIIYNRKKKEIKKTFDLINIIKKVTNKNKINNYISKIFQIIRNYINKDNLKNILKNIILKYLYKGIIIIISFHSIEDNIIKNMFYKNKFKKKIKLLKIIPQKLEIFLNYKSRSSIMRIILKL